MNVLVRSFVGRWLVAGAVMSIAIVPAMSSTRIAHAAGVQDVHTWITVGSLQPGLGCSVPVSVEVRTEGEAVAGASISVAFFGDGVDVSSTDQAVTDGDGVALVFFDTSDVRSGANSWLDITVADTYIGGTEISPSAEGSCDGDSKLISIEAQLAISSAVIADAESSNAVLIDGVPAHQQERNLSCEYAAVQIATSVFGDPIYEDDYLNSAPQSDNPHYGFRGDIDGPWGVTDDYGIYAEALVPNLEAHGYVGEVSYGADASYLQSEIDAGHPTLVWIATRGDTGFYDTDVDGSTFKLVPFEHVVVAYGYDETGVYISDPGNASYQHLSWSWFLDAWSVMDGMALSVYPA